MSLKTYIFILSFWLIILGISYANLKYKNKTDNIFILNNGSEIKCANKIKINNFKNAYTYIKSDQIEKKFSLESEICSISKHYDSSNKDRMILFKYVKTKLNSWAINRPDIAQYFYKKIIESNPNDALSLYIKEEKLNDYNNQ